MSTNNDGGPAVGGELEQIVARWRDEAMALRDSAKSTSPGNGVQLIREAKVLERDADELEATLQSLTSRQSAGAVAWRFRWPNGTVSEWNDACAKPMHYVNGELHDGPHPDNGIEYAYTHPAKSEAGAVVDDAMVERMARVVAKRAGEDYDAIGEFAQTLLKDTQRAALVAALENKDG